MVSPVPVILSLPTANRPGSEPAALLELAKHADAVGFGGVLLTDPYLGAAIEHG